MNDAQQPGPPGTEKLQEQGSPLTYLEHQSAPRAADFIPVYEPTLGETEERFLLDALRSQDMFLAGSFLMFLSLLTVVGMFLSDLALAVSIRGDVAMASDDIDAALTHYLDALVLRQHVAGATDATRHRRCLSLAWGRVGQVRMKLGDRVGARAAWERAWELMEDLTQRDPGNVAWAMEASVAGCRWGDVAYADDELDQAERAWTEALRIREQLAAQDPENGRWQEYLAVAVGRMARLARARGEPRAAMGHAKRALRISEQLVEEHPEHAGWQAGLERARERVRQLRQDATSGDGDLL